MKKLGAIILSILMLLFTSSVFCTQKNAFAVDLINQEEHSYLINPDYEQNKEFYGITNDQIIRLSRPFNGVDAMMPGQSFAPFLTDVNTRTYNTNPATISANDALSMYVYFSEVYSKNLAVTLSGQNFNVSWQIGANLINEQLEEISNVRHVRYGWLKIVLPVSAATVSGELSSVENITINYNITVDPTVKYSSPYFYAPEVVSATNNNITFADKQNYYNFAFTLPNTSNLCVGDKLKISSVIDILDYAIIGDIDYLNPDMQNLRDYKLSLEITNLSTNNTSVFEINNNAMEYAFDQTGSYLVNVTLYSSNVTLWQTETQTLKVNDFVAFYISGTIENLKVGQSTQYDINKGKFADSLSNITAKVSNSSVADVKVENGKLIVLAKKAGKVKITLSADAARQGQDVQNYTVEYTLTVTKNATTSWLAIILLAIGLIICVIIVYTIMVNRRLIKNKYPKY